MENCSNKSMSNVRFSISEDVIPDDFSVNPSKEIQPTFYYQTLAQTRQRLPFSAVQGKISPYTKRPIRTLDDYTTYCSCLALRIACEIKISEAQKEVDAAKTAELSAKMIASASEKREVEATNELSKVSAEKAKYKSRSTVLSLVALVLFVLCVVGRSTKRQSTDTVQSKPEVSESSSAPAPTERNAAEESNNSSAGTGSKRPEGYASDKYIGNKNSHKFHRPMCSYLPDADNQKTFSSREAAINAGYEPCKRCDP